MHNWYELQIEARTRVAQALLQAADWRRTANVRWRPARFLGLLVEAIRRRSIWRHRRLRATVEQT